MKKETKIISAMYKAKKLGYIYVSSVIKNIYATTYYHIVKIDDIIKEGKWIPANKVSMYPGKSGNWYGPIGSSKRPKKCIHRSEALKLVC